MTQPFQQSPYLRVQRDFPGNDVKMLAVQSDKAYIDVAQAVNSRVIGTYALNISIVNGERWYTTGSTSAQQALRQFYQFTSSGSIPHYLNFAAISFFSKCFGSFTDGTNYYGAIYGSNVAIAGNVSFYITPTNIVIQAGAGAPSITSGIIVLEWVAVF